MGSFWAVSGAVLPAFPKAFSAILMGSSRPLPNGWLALDSLLSEYNYWSQPALLATFMQTGVRSLRYPGGAIGQFWDWSTGRMLSDPLLDLFIPPGLSPTNTNSNYPLQHLSIPQAQVIYTTNFTHGNLRLKNQGSADPTADAAPALQSAIEALEFASSNNISISHIELGSGFIPHGEDWIYSLGEFLFGHQKDGLPDYPTVAASWARSIKAAFPAARLAYNGGDLSTPEQDAFHVNWNRAAIQRLESESSVEAAAIQLFIPADLGVEHLTNPGEGSAGEQQAQYQALHDPASLRALFNAPHARLESLFGSQASSMPIRQSRFRIWVTGFNLDDPIGAVRHTWAHGLAVASYLGALLRQPQVDVAVLHNITGQRCGAFLDKNAFNRLWLDFPGLDLFRLKSSLPEKGLSAAGWALAFFAQAMDSMDTAVPLHFSDLPADQVWGWQFTHSRSPVARFILANLTDSPVTTSLSGLTGDQPITLTTLQANPASYITGIDLPQYPEFSLHRTQFKLSPDKLFTIPAYGLMKAETISPKGSGHLFLPFISR